MPNQLPPLTREERAAALEKAARARKERSELKLSLKRGEMPLSDVIEDAATDAVIAKTYVLDLIRAMPGIGDVRAKQIMERLGIAESRRVGGLGPNQRDALVAEFEPELEPVLM